MSGGAGQQDGPLAAAISTTVVRALARTTGRGPTKARTTLGENGVFVVLQDSLTRGEQTLADAGEGGPCSICADAGSASCRPTSAARSSSSPDAR